MFLELAEKNSKYIDLSSHKILRPMIKEDYDPYIAVKTEDGIIYLREDLTDNIPLSELIPLEDDYFLSGRSERRERRERRREARTQRKEARTEKKQTKNLMRQARAEAKQAGGGRVIDKIGGIVGNIFGKEAEAGATYEATGGGGGGEAEAHNDTMKYALFGGIALLVVGGILILTKKK